MLKKIFNLINKKKNTENVNESENKVEIDSDIKAISTIKDDEINEEKEAVAQVDVVINLHEEPCEDKNEKLIKENEYYIKDIKIRREKGIRAVDLYNEEIVEFKTYKECSRKLKVPLAYIKENLKYGHTDYLGVVINYLKQELGEVVEDEIEYLNSSRTPIELFNILNNKIFKIKISEERRDEILSSEKIEPIKMHYKFECIDEDYDDYFKKYGAIIKRGGNKKVELINQKGEVIEVFKSLDSCSEYINKDRNEIVDMLKYGYTKVGRYEIRYSLRNI